MKSPRWLPLTLFVLLAVGAGAIGAAATGTSVHTWYVGLSKPGWNPPDWIFAPIWTLLYLFMAVATWRVWKTGNPTSARRTVSLYSAQLSLNALWSILFFGPHRIGAALVDTTALLALLVVVLIRYWRADRTAAAMWIPYVAWVGFATALNLAIWQLN